jgi:1-deoxy-D-xylulose-5-phosphate synthase
LRYLKPLDEELLHEVGRQFKKVITVEDGVIKGGMGSAVLEFMSDNNYYPHVKRIGIPDLFIEHGSVQELHSLCEIDAPAICKVIIEMHNQEV